MEEVLRESAQEEYGDNAADRGHDAPAHRVCLSERFHAQADEPLAGRRVDGVPAFDCEPGDVACDEGCVVVVGPRALVSECDE